MTAPSGAASRARPRAEVTPATYNRGMDLPFLDLWLPAVRNRMVLFANHVLTSCPPAVERLRAHAGKSLRVDVSGWPGLIPVPPPLTLRVTPAGLFEAVEAAEEGALTPDLSVSFDASAPTKVAESVFKGGVPPMSIDGDAAFAGDFNWIAQNVRWDPAADAERFFGPTVGEGISRASAGFAQAAEVARNAMGQMFEMLQSRGKKN
jgi:ubiquinone biosynthesis protein UbiJ